MNRSVYIVNFWHGAAYGGPLTAYALQKIVQSQNYSALLIDNKSFVDNLINSKFIFTNKFWEKCFKTTSNANNYNDFLNFNDSGEIFIVGSDQVFRPKYIKNKEYQYFLDFTNSNKKKIAFSASFGVDKEQFLKENSTEIIEHMKKSLQSFDFISVREKSGVEICKDVLGVEAEWIIDPVFIIDKSIYENLIKDSTDNYSDKIVSYVLDTDKTYKKIYKYLEKKYNKKIFETANSNISVENWLKSIRDCKLFITDSFHGMCFALIFNKPFICVANKGRGTARFDSICEMLNIENQCLNSIDEVFEHDCIFKVDYTKVNQRIEEERQKGLDFLKRVLEAPSGKVQEKEEVRTKYLEDKICELEKQANLKYQIKKELWNLWLVIFHQYLPTPIQNIIIIIRKQVKRG